MGRIYISGQKEVSYEDFVKLREAIINFFKEKGFKTEGEEQEVFVRYEE